MPLGWIAAGSAVLNYLGTQDTNSANAAAAANTNALQLESAQNKYQWTVADMQKAGLNPMLAYSQGAQGVGSLATPTFQNPVASATAAATQAVQAENVSKDTELKAAQADLVDAQAAKTRAETPVGQDQVDLMASRVKQAVNDASLSSATVNKVQEEANNARLTGQLIQVNTGNAQVDQEIKRFNMMMIKARAPNVIGFENSAIGAAAPYIDAGLGAARGASSAASAMATVGAFK